MIPKDTNMEKEILNKRIYDLWREGCVVSRIFPRDILEFLKNFAVERNLPREIRNLIVDSPKCAETAYSMMDIKELDFENCSENSQNLYFKNAAFRITAEAMEASS